MAKTLAGLAKSHGSMPSAVVRTTSDPDLPEPTDCASVAILHNSGVPIRCRPCHRAGARPPRQVGVVGGPSPRKSRAAPSSTASRQPARALRARNSLKDAPSAAGNPQVAAPSSPTLQEQL